MGEDLAPHYNDFLPALNATLNSLSAVFLSLGYVFIQYKRVHAHRNMMIAAFVVSAAFLVSYLYYHFTYTARHFPGEGLARTLYYVMLVTHIFGAILIVPGILRMLYLARKQLWHKHRSLGAWVWPIWMYVSVTGVLVYFCLYGVSS